MRTAATLIMTADDATFAMSDSHCADEAAVQRTDPIAKGKSKPSHNTMHF